MMTTARLVIVAAFACWGAVDIARRLLLWSDRVHRDLDAIDRKGRWVETFPVPDGVTVDQMPEIPEAFVRRNKATRRTLGDVAKYR